MRARLTMTAACLVLAFTATQAPAASHHSSGRGLGCHSASCTERMARKRCWRGNVHSCIHRAALHWGQSWPVMETVAGCESGHDPGEVNGSSGASGLFQFLWKTWAENRYAMHSVLSAKWNALGAAWEMARHGLAPWFASRGCWG